MWWDLLNWTGQRWGFRKPFGGWECLGSGAMMPLPKDEKADEPVGSLGIHVEKLMVDKKQAASMFEEIAMLLELKGENPFRSRSYIKAARAVQDLEEDLTKLVESGDIAKVDGIGKGTAEKLQELVKTGKMAYYDELRASFPAGLLDMLSIPGLGPKKARVLYDKLEIASLEDLEKACTEDKVMALDGFGKKSQEKILKGIQQVRKYQGRFLVNKAAPYAKQLLDFLRALPEVQQVEVGGSLRRRKETVKDIDFVSATLEPEAVMEAFVNHELSVDTIAHGPTKSSITLENGINVDLRCVTPDQYAYALMHFTGSKEHNTIMRSRAKQYDMKLNEYGLFKGEELVPCESETEIYKALDLHFIPPELREDRGEFEWAEERDCERLLEVDDLQGIFHAHSTYSDGAATLEEMGEAARAMGMQYLGMTDHSRTAYYAGGLSIERVIEQQKEIDTLNEKWDDFRLFKGIESDILTDGSLDYPQEILDSFDFIIASIHSQFNMSEEDMTARIIKAIEHPATTMIGHLTGRLLLSREAYPVNVYKVIDAAVANNVIIEINANPYRLDLDWRVLGYGRDKGLVVSINPDAHSTRGLSDIEYGVGIARKGKLGPDHVFNTRSLKDIEQQWGLS